MEVAFLSNNYTLTLPRKRIPDQSKRPFFAVKNKTTRFSSQRRKAQTQQNAHISESVSSCRCILRVMVKFIARSCFHSLDLQGAAYTTGKAKNGITENIVSWL